MRVKYTASPLCARVASDRSLRANPKLFIEPSQDCGRLAGPIEPVPGSHLISPLYSSACMRLSDGIGGDREIDSHRVGPLTPRGVDIDCVDTPFTRLAHNNLRNINKYIAEQHINLDTSRPVSVNSRLRPTRANRASPKCSSSKLTCLLMVCGVRLRHWLVRAMLPSFATAQK